MLNSIRYSAITVVLRGGANVALVLVLARLLPLPEFGLFTFGLAGATILGLVVDYGFTSLLLRDLAGPDANVAARVSGVLRAKVALVAATILLLALGVRFAGWSAAEAKVVSLLMLGQVANSFGNLLLVPFKCRDRYDVESLWTGIEALALLFGCGAVAYWYPSASCVAAAYLSAKALYLLGTTWSYAHRFGWGGPRSGVWKELRLALPFGVHLFVGTAYLNVDTVIMKQSISLADIGLYQAGIRIVTVGSMVFAVVNSVLIPRLTALYLARNRAFFLLARRSLILVGAVGAAAGLPLILFPGPTMGALFGSQYAAAADAVSILGLVLVARFAGTVPGVLLTISGRQTVRAVATFLTLIGLIGADLWAIPRYGIVGAAWVLLSAHCVLLGVYLLYTRLEYGTLFLKSPTAIAAYR